MTPNAPATRGRRKTVKSRALRRRMRTSFVTQVNVRSLGTGPVRQVAGRGPRGPGAVGRHATSGQESDGRIDSTPAWSRPWRAGAERVTRLGHVSHIRVQVRQATPVSSDVQLGWPAAARPAALADGDLVGLLGDHDPDPAGVQCATADPAEYALSAITASGLVRGRPPARRGMRMSARPRRAGRLLRCPPVTTAARGRPRPSNTAWIVVVNPPRERPMP